MNPEKMLMSFPGQKKAEIEAHKINDAVDAYYANPRTKKSRSVDEVAHEAIKNEKSAPINLARLSEEERRWYENIMDAGIRFLDDGFVEISRWDDMPSKEKSRTRLWQKVDGINSAIRMQDHILAKYRLEKRGEASEFSRIESIQEVIEYANELLNRWSKATPEDKKELQWQLAEVVLQLENCRNEFKVATRDQAGAVMTLKDKLNRENPSAFAARTVGALNNLSKRMNEMQLIMPMMAMRKEELTFEKRRISGVFKKSAAHLLGITRHPVFRDNPRKPADQMINANEVVELDRKIGKVLYLLGSVRVAPYFQQAEQAKYCLSAKVKNFFGSKKRLLENLNNINEALKEAMAILESSVEHLG